VQNGGAVTDVTDVTDSHYYQRYYAVRCITPFIGGRVTSVTGLGYRLQPVVIFVGIFLMRRQLSLLCPYL
jgi:hypothetical protein